MKVNNSLQDSGVGRESLEAFEEPEHVHIDPKVECKEWCPYGK